MCPSILFLLSIFEIALGTNNYGNNSTSGDTKYLPLVNRPMQSILLILILTTAVIFNGAVITNISRDRLKTRMVHFVLIRHVCVADFIGACVVLPVPLVAILKGQWDVSDSNCAIISVTTASVWTMHLVAVAVYRADRVGAVWLTTGNYPILSIRWLNALLTTTWLVVIALASLATFHFGQAYQPTLMLCIPNVPIIFFIIVFSGYISGLVALTTGYLYAFCRRRRKRKKEQESEQPEEDSQPGEKTGNPIIRRHSIDLAPRSSQTSQHRRSHSDETNTIRVEFGSQNVNVQRNGIYKYLKTKNSARDHRRTGSMATRAIYSYSISLGHLLLYLPSIMVVGLVKQPPNLIALVCGLIVYCEFLIQPAALLFLSPRLRREVFY